MTILYAQNIFIPNEYFLEKNMTSIHSFFEVIYNNNKDYDFIIKFGGWSATDDLWSCFLDRMSMYNNIIIDILRYDENYGKAWSVNRLTSNEKFDFLLTADSDIIFIQPDIIFRSLNVYKNDDKFGLIAMNQKDNSCHIYNSLNSSYDINGEILIYNKQPAYIAGGCLIIKNELWQKINGYRVMGVYAGDDAYILSDCHNHGYKLGMAKDLYVIHPTDTIDLHQYNLWKIKVCHRDSYEGSVITNDKIQETYNFWKL